MADHGHRGVESGDERLEPVEPVEVEVVGGLVEQEDVEAGQERGRQRHPRRLPARQRRGGLVQHPLVEAEVGEGRRRRGPPGRGRRARASAPGRRHRRRRRRRCPRRAPAWCAPSGPAAGPTPVRRARKSATVSSVRRSGSWGSSPTVAVGGATVTDPASGSASPARTRRRVDLPVPFGPTTPTRCPGASVHDTAARTGSGPNESDRSRAVSVAMGTVESPGLDRPRRTVSRNVRRNPPADPPTRRRASATHIDAKPRTNVSRNAIDRPGRHRPGRRLGQPRARWRATS